MPLADTIEKIKADRRAEKRKQQDALNDALRHCIRRDFKDSADEIEIKISGGIADVIVPGHRKIGAMFNVDREVEYWTGNGIAPVTMNLADALIAAEIRED